MISELGPYIEYKDSGSQWLGLIPSAWKVRKLRTLIRRRNERNQVDLPLLSVAREKGVFVRSLTDPDENHNVIPEDLSNYKVARKGSLVINKMKAWQGSMGIAPCDGIVSPAYYVFELDIHNRMYAQRLFRSKHYISHFAQASDGVRVGQWDLSTPGMREIPVLLPSDEEQSSIVRFLDWADGRLELTIRAKRKVIGLLNEQKRAVIYRSVTRGLDSAVSLKNSGISWLGYIPQHWETRRIKQLTKILRGKFSHRPRNDSSLYDGAYPFIQTGSVAQAGRYITSYKQTLNEKGLAVSMLFPKGTLVMTIAANIGDVAILDFDACFPDSVIGFIPNERLNRDYLYYVFTCMKEELIQDAPVNTQGNLSVERIGPRSIPMPPFTEQAQIVEAIERLIAPIDEAVFRTETEIRLLVEYRARLVADVVIGRLDIRKAALMLLDADTPEAVEEDVELVSSSETIDKELAI